VLGGIGVGCDHAGGGTLPAGIRLVEDRDLSAQPAGPEAPPASCAGAESTCTKSPDGRRACLARPRGTGTDVVRRDWRCTARVSGQCAPSSRLAGRCDQLGAVAGKSSVALGCAGEARPAALARAAGCDRTTGGPALCGPGAEKRDRRGQRRRLIVVAAGACGQTSRTCAIQRRRCSSHAGVQGTPRSLARRAADRVRLPGRATAPRPCRQTRRTTGVPITHRLGQLLLLGVRVAEPVVVTLESRASCGAGDLRGVSAPGLQRGAHRRRV
jgi:hypothetical protein